MIVNIYIRESDNQIIGTLVDEGTEHRLGDVIELNNDPIQKVITKIVRSDHFDYSSVIKFNYYKDHDDNSVEDVAEISIEPISIQLRT